MTDEAIDQELSAYFEVETEAEAESNETETEAEVETEVETEATEEVDEEAETTTAESEETTDHEPQQVPLAALLDERRQKQAFKEEAERLKALVPKKQEAPDPYEDLEGYNEYMRKEWEADQAEKSNRERMSRIEEQRSAKLQTNPDLIQMEKIWEVMTAENPDLINDMIKSGNEVDFVYNKAKEYRDSLLKPAQAEPAKTTPKTVPNLATATAQGNNNVQIEKEPDIDDVFADVKY